MLDPTPDPTKLATVVVAEDQAPCDVPFEHLRGLSFLRQEPDEDLVALGARVARHVARTRKHELIVESAWLLLSLHHDEQRLAMRRAIARTLADVLARSSRGGGLTIITSAHASTGNRTAAFSLAEAVLEGQASALTTVRVRFVGSAEPPRAPRPKAAVKAAASSA